MVSVHLEPVVHLDIPPSHPAKFAQIHGLFALGPVSGALGGRFTHEIFVERIARHQ